MFRKVLLNSASKIEYKIPNVSLNAAHCPNKDSKHVIEQMLLFKKFKHGSTFSLQAEFIFLVMHIDDLLLNHYHTNFNSPPLISYYILINSMNMLSNALLIT